MILISFIWLISLPVSRLIWRGRCFALAMRRRIWRSEEALPSPVCKPRTQARLQSQQLLARRMTSRMQFTAWPAVSLLRLWTAASPAMTAVAAAAVVVADAGVAPSLRHDTEHSMRKCFHLYLHCWRSLTM